MTSQGGYAIVDVDDEVGDLSGQGPNKGLEFKTFLGTDTGNQNDGRHSPSMGSGSGGGGVRGDTPTVPFSIFNLTYYQSYFDVTTKTVVHRCLMACIPRPGFINDVCEERVDLYGPFWTLTTLILTTYLSSSLSTSLYSYYLTSTPQKADLTLLSLATTLIYAYGLLLPAVFWAATRWFSGTLLGGGINGAGVGEGGGGEWSLVEALGIWGYGMGVFVPVSILCLIPIPIFRWILVGGAAISSGLFIVRNVYPVLAASSDNKLPRLLIIIVVVLHAAIALTMKVMFYSSYVAGKTVGPADPITDGQIGGGGGGDNDGGEEVSEMIKRWLSL